MLFVRQRWWRCLSHRVFGYAASFTAVSLAAALVAFQCMSLSAANPASFWHFESRHSWHKDAIRADREGAALNALHLLPYMILFFTTHRTWAHFLLSAISSKRGVESLALNSSCDPHVVARHTEYCHPALVSSLYLSRNCIASVVQRLGYYLWGKTSPRSGPDGTGWKPD